MIPFALQQNPRASHRHRHSPFTMHREVCHKHRNIRRENHLRVRAPKSWQRCLFYFNSLHSVTAAFLVVNEAVPGQIRLGEPNFFSVRKAKSSSQWFANPPYPVQPPCRESGNLKSEAQTAETQSIWGARPFFLRIRESQRTRLVWDQDKPGAAPGYPTLFHLVCSLTVRASGS